MCRHMFDTTHGLTRCPACEVFIVGRAFRASLQRAIDAYKARQVRAAAASSSESDAAADILALPSRSTMVIDVATHAHLAAYSSLRIFEKDVFKRPGVPEDYGLVSVAKTDALSLRSQSGSAYDSECHGPFRCIDCQTVAPTWTQFTRHLDSTEHTLPRCVDCRVALKCFGRMRPYKHEEITGHTGHWGVYYNKSDYSTRSQEEAYNRSNMFTGLSTPQYRCVCGVTFIHPVHLAVHLASIHGASCVPATATCRHCQLTMPLKETLLHLFRPMTQSSSMIQLDEHCDEITPPPEEERASTPESTPQSSQQVTPRQGPVFGHPACAHDVVMDDFSAAPFLIYRPLMASAPSASVRGSKPFYVVAYQCRECLLLFSSWELVVQHLQVTGHHRCYCVSCKNFFPAHRQLSTSPLAVNYYLNHLSVHPHMLGTPPTADVLEVLVDLNSAEFTEQWYVANGKLPDPEAVLCYQCPAEGCCQVFAYYGDLVEHFMSTCHDGEQVTMPMIQCRAQFLRRDLVERFGWMNCPHCTRPFPANRLTLHTDLCMFKYFHATS